MIKTLLIDSSSPLGNDARPRDREAIGVDTELAHQSDIFLPATIMITCDIPILALPDFSTGMRKGIPHAQATIVDGYRTFNLICGRRCPPQKIVGEISRVNHRTS